MTVNKIFSVLLLFPFFSSCADRYKIEGTSSVNRLDGKMLYLEVLKDDGWVKIDSSEVAHGAFSMKGDLDSVCFANLFLDTESILPIVLEKGKITVNISDADLSAGGTPLNKSLYGFIAKRNELEKKLSDLGQRETDWVLDGGDLDEIRPRLIAESDSLVNEMNQCVKTFISDNYETILGPGVFSMLCASLPYPIITPQVDDIIKDAPYSFKNHRLVKEFLSKARENEKLIEEHQRMEENAAIKGK